MHLCNLSISISCCQASRYPGKMFLRICYPKVNEKKARKVDTKLNNAQKVKLECKEELNENGQKIGTAKVKTEVKQERSTKVIPILLEPIVFSERVSPFLRPTNLFLRSFRYELWHVVWS